MPRQNGERRLRFRAYDACGKSSTAQVLDFRGAVNFGLEPVGDYAHRASALEISWRTRDPIQAFVCWEESGYGPAYLLLDNRGKGYTVGGTRNLNVELAQCAERWFDRAYKENVQEPEVGFEPSDELMALRKKAYKALARMAAARSESSRAVAASKALAKTLAAWTALLQEYGRAFARRRRAQFILGAMMTEPYADAWQYSVATMFSDYERRLELMKQQGLDTVGIVFLWREDYTFSRPETLGPYDRVIDYARRIGLNVMGMVLDSFDYLTHRGLSDARFVEASRIQARNLAMHYRGRVRFWTVTDEANGKNFLPHTFEARLRAGNEAARVIKQIDPSAVTLATLLFDEDFLPLLARLKSQNALVPEVDVIALSLFQHLGPGVDIVYRKIHELFPDKRIGVGETGYTAGRDCDLIYSAPLNYSYGLGGGFWWFHWDGMIDRGIDGQWYTTRFYDVVQNLAKAISSTATHAESPPSLEGPEPTTHSEQTSQHRSRKPGLAAETPHSLNEFEGAAWRGSRWLLESGVYDPRTGAVREAYDPVSKGYFAAEVSSVAAALEVFVECYGRNRQSAYLDAARQAARYLATQQHSGSGPRVTGSIVGPARRAESLADARAIEALLDFYFATGEEKYLEVSEKAAGWLLGFMQNPDGSFKCAYDLKARSFVDGVRDDWKHTRAFAHAKIAAALFKVWEAVRETEPRYREGARRVLDWALGLQNFNGSFKGHYNPRRAQASDDKFVSSLLEGVEGLFSAYAYLLRHPRDIVLHPVYFEACRNFAGWLIEFAQGPEGGVWAWVYGDDSHTAAAALPTAQATRLLLRLHLVTRDDRYLAAARRAGDFLVKLQQRRGSARSEGGFAGGNHASSPDVICTRTTALASTALLELSAVLNRPGLNLNPAAPRYSGFDPLF